MITNKEKRRRVRTDEFSIFTGINNPLSIGDVVYKWIRFKKVYGEVMEIQYKGFMFEGLRVRYICKAINTQNQ